MCKGGKYPYCKQIVSHWKTKLDHFRDFIHQIFYWHFFLLTFTIFKSRLQSSTHNLPKFGLLLGHSLFVSHTYRNWIAVFFFIYFSYLPLKRSLLSENHLRDIFWISWALTPFYRNVCFQGKFVKIWISLRSHLKRTHP